jgi:hypothetical protein
MSEKQGSTPDNVEPSQDTPSNASPSRDNESRERANKARAETLRFIKCLEEDEDVKRDLGQEYWQILELAHRTLVVYEKRRTTR